MLGNWGREGGIVLTGYRDVSFGGFVSVLLARAPRHFVSVTFGYIGYTPPTGYITAVDLSPRQTSGFPIGRSMPPPCCLDLVFVLLVSTSCFVLLVSSERSVPKRSYLPTTAHHREMFRSHSSSASSLVAATGGA